MKRKMKVFFAILACFTLIVPATIVQGATTITSNQTGNHDGYDYELWKDSGNTSMTLNNGGNFSCEWNNINNALFRKGKKFNETQTHQQLGNISVDYGCNYQPNGNSYLCIYGWTVDPLVEFYIVDSWGDWRPPGASSKGTVSIDGGTYDIYETTRTNQPSIRGNATFQQYWSVRTSKRTSGTISVSEHFKAWESRGMRLGKMYEVALTVEGWQSSGSANVYSNSINIGGSGYQPDPTPDPDPTPVDPNATRKECESMSISGPYAGEINNPFSGVALYANEDSVKFTQNFSSGNNSFSLRGCSNNDNMAEVDLKIGGQYKGTFYFGGSHPAVYTIDNVSHQTGNQEVELVVSSDDGQWDAFIDYLDFTGNGNGGQPSPDPDPVPEDPVAIKKECESMNISGPYAGNISNPFSGVALYANGDSVKFTQYFSSGNNSFSLLGCSNNNNMARVDLRIGGQHKGTFYYGGSNPAVYTINNVSHQTGNQEIELIVTADDGQWDAFIDYLEIN